MHLPVISLCVMFLISDFYYFFSFFFFVQHDSPRPSGQLPFHVQCITAKVCLYPYRYIKMENKLSSYLHTQHFTNLKRLKLSL